MQFCREVVADGRVAPISSRFTSIIINMRARRKGNEKIAASDLIKDLDRIVLRKEFLDPILQSF